MRHKKLLLTLCFFCFHTLAKESVLDPRTCGPYQQKEYLKLLTFEKNKHPKNKLYVVIKVDEDCQIDPQSSLPDFYWIMGEKEKKGIIPCQNLDSDDFEYWFPFAPGSQLDKKNQRAFRSPVLENDARGFFINYTTGMMSMVAMEWATKFPGEMIGRTLRIETYKNEQGGCEARQWATLNKNGKKEKIWINYIYLKINLNLLINASWEYISVKGKTFNHQDFSRTVIKKEE